MNLWELNKAIESAIPAWMPFALLAVAVAIYFIVTRIWK